MQSEFISYFKLYLIITHFIFYSEMKTGFHRSRFLRHWKHCCSCSVKRCWIIIILATSCMLKRTGWIGCNYRCTIKIIFRRQSAQIYSIYRNKQTFRSDHQKTHVKRQKIHRALAGRCVKGTKPGVKSSRVQEMEMLLFYWRCHNYDATVASSPSSHSCDSSTLSTWARHQRLFVSLSDSWK